MGQLRLTTRLGLMQMDASTVSQKLSRGFNVTLVYVNYVWKRHDGQIGFDLLPKWREVSIKATSNACLNGHERACDGVLNVGSMLLAVHPQQKANGLLPRILDIATR